MVINKKIAVISLAVIFFVCLGLITYLNYHYMDTRPDRPQPEINRIYPLNVHGSVVYLNKQEHYIIKILSWSMGALFIVIAIFVIVFNPLESDKK